MWTRLFAILVVQFFLANGVAANDFKFVLKSNVGDEFYINEASIEKSSKGYQVEILNSYGHADPFNKAWSSLQIINFDCNQSMQVLADEFYSEKMGEGSIVQRNSSPLPNMKVPERSVFWIIQNEVCSLNTSGERMSNDTKIRLVNFSSSSKKWEAVRIQYAIENGLMGQTEAYNFMQKLSVENVSNESVILLGSICQNVMINDCAQLLIEANNWPKGVDDYASLLTTLLQSSSSN